MRLQDSVGCVQSTPSSEGMPTLPDFLTALHGPPAVTHLLALRLLLQIPMLFAWQRGPPPPPAVEATPRSLVQAPARWPAYTAGGAPSWSLVCDLL